MFTGIVIQTWNDNSPVRYIFIVLALSNILFLAETLLLRKRYNKAIENKLVIEAKAEEIADDNTRENLNKMKQVLLEGLVEAEIKTKLPEAKYIKNAYIPKNDGSFSEIDFIVISTLGVFILECKNVTGIIQGNWKQEYLMIKHPGGSEYQMYNPIHQNDTHFKLLKNILGLKSDVFRSVVVFGYNAQIANYRDEKPFHAEICHPNTLISSMKKLQERHKTGLESHIVESVYSTLEPYIRKTDEKARIHLERIKKKTIDMNLN
jgi:hypothetical protein